MTVKAGQPAPNKGKTYPAEVLTPAEVGALLEACSRRASSGIRDRALIMLLYRSGLRVSEILALRPADVDYEHHSVRVLHGKGNKATTRGFHPSAEDALLRWTDERKRLGIRGGRLFCDLQGGPLTTDAVRKMLRRRAAKAGVDKRVHPHGLRHTYAAELERAGLTVTEICRLLGHSSTAITARYLASLTNDVAIRALEAADLPDLTELLK